MGIVALHVFEDDLVVLSAINMGRHQKEDVAEKKFERLIVIVLENRLSNGRVLLKNFNKGVQDP